MKDFIKGVMSELHNITWPTKKHAVNISKITIIFTIICALFIGVSDYLLSEGYSFWSSLNPDNQIIPEIYTGTGTDSPIQIEDIQLDTEAVETASGETK